MARKTLDSWIQEALTDPDKGKCTMLALIHMVGQQQRELHATRLSGAKAWTAKDLAAMFRGKAETYAQDLPGVQTFQLQAFYEGNTQPAAFQPFTVTPPADASGLTTEAPTEQGRTQQIMRQNEMLFSQCYRRQQALDDYAMRVIQQQASHIDTLSKENRDMFTIFKEMMMEKALDDHNRKMSQLTFERTTLERKKWMSFLPALVNTVLGREVFPQGVADTALVESIADSLSEADLMKLSTVVKPELMGPLAARMHQYMLKKNQDDENLKALSASASKADPALELGEGE